MMRAWYVLSYVLWILVEIVKGSIELSKGVYSPSTRSSPAIIEYPLRATTDIEIIAMASSITITPGTLVVGTAHGTDDEGPSLFVHVLFAESREQIMEDLSEMEERLLRATRGQGGAEEALQPRRHGLADPHFVDGAAVRRLKEAGPRGDHGDDDVSAQTEPEADRHPTSDRHDSLEDPAGSEEQR